MTESAYWMVVPLTEEIEKVPSYPAAPTPETTIEFPIWTLFKGALSMTVTTLPDSLMALMANGRRATTTFGKVNVVTPVNPLTEDANSGVKAVTTSAPLGSTLPAVATNTRPLLGTIMA